LFDPSGWSPPIAAILNVTPNHLDRHGTMSAYIAAKRQILAHQHDRDMAILNLDNPITREMAETSHKKRRILWFSTNQEVKQGACLQDGALVVRWEGHQEVVCRTEDLKLLGHHNLANALAACALGTATAAPIEAVRQAVTTFRGVEHRLELCSQRLGVRWYDDSIATTPERAAAALRAFPEDRIVLLAGGRDKHLAWDELAELVWQRVEHLILFGEAAELIEEAVRNAPASQSGVSQLHQAGTLESAIEIAAEVAKPGDVVLLSPGGTSFDAYRDFAARGDHFQELVRALG
jgi:UDP-N-acetylmuramoylalanine--D-glutamate ligase